MLRRCQCPGFDNTDTKMSANIYGPSTLFELNSLKTFDIEIPDEAAEGIATVGDAVKYIEDKQG